MALCSGIVLMPLLISMSTMLMCDRHGNSIDLSHYKWNKTRVDYEFATALNAARREQLRHQRRENSALSSLAPMPKGFENSGGDPQLWARSVNLTEFPDVLEWLDKDMSHLARCYGEEHQAYAIMSLLNIFFFFPLASGCIIINCCCDGAFQSGSQDIRHVPLVVQTNKILSFLCALVRAFAGDSIFTETGQPALQATTAIGVIMLSLLIKAVQTAFVKGRNNLCNVADHIKLKSHSPGVTGSCNIVGIIYVRVTIFLYCIYLGMISLTLDVSDVTRAYDPATSTLNGIINSANYSDTLPEVEHFRQLHLALYLAGLFLVLITGFTLYKVAQRHSAEARTHARGQWRKSMVSLGYVLCRYGCTGPCTLTTTVA